MDALPQLAASIGGGVILFLTAVYAFIHVFKSFRESSGAKVTDIESVARAALDSLKMERERVTELYARVDMLANENHVLRQTVARLEGQVASLKREQAGLPPEGLE